MPGAETAWSRARRSVEKGKSSLATWKSLFNSSTRSSRSSRDRRASRFVLAGLILALAACQKPEVALAYRFDNGRVTSYRWKIEATTGVESATQPETHRLTLFLEAVETVLPPTAEGRGAVRWRIRTTKRIEDGVEVAPEVGDLHMTLEIGPDGTIARSTLEPVPSAGLEIERLLSESYPRLPTASLSIGETWDAPVRIALERTSVDLAGNGRLLGFELERRRRLARIEITRNGQVTSVQPVEQVQLSISGTSSATIGAMIDVDAGILFSADSVSTSRFEIGPETGAASGTRHIRMESTIELSR